MHCTIMINYDVYQISIVSDNLSKANVSETDTWKMHF